MLQLIELFVNFAVHLVVTMSDAHRNDPAEKIQILFAVGIPKILILGARDHQRRLEIMKNRGEQKLALRKQDLVFRHNPTIVTCTVLHSARNWRDCQSRAGYHPAPQRWYAACYSTQ